MAERQSSLAHIPRSGAPGSLVLSEARYMSVLQIQAWPQTLDDFRVALAESLGGASVPVQGSASHRDGTVIAAIAPGRFLVASADANLAGQLSERLGHGRGSVSDVSHGRVVMALEGAGAEPVLSKCVRIDLDLDVFPPGRVAQTAIHHIDVLIHRQTETRFEIWVLRSFAEALAEWLLDHGVDQAASFHG